MKHLKLYEEFSKEERLDEGAVKKFLTGHKDSEESKNAQSRILSDIDSKVKKLVSSGHLKEDDIEKYKDKLKKQAKDNNWKGKVVTRKSKTGKVFVVYDNGTSSLQDLGKAASRGIK